MPWLAVDLLLVLLALLLLGFLALRLWRQVKDLTAAVGRAGDTLAPATRAMAQAQTARVQRAATFEATSRSTSDA